MTAHLPQDLGRESTGFQWDVRGREQSFVETRHARRWALCWQAATAYASGESSAWM